MITTAGQRWTYGILHNDTERELIFWDNHSIDNSKKIFEKFKDKRFKYYLSPKHTFLYEARDQAIKESKGEFIAFCDVDDFWSKEKLECLIPLFSDRKVGIAYSNVWLFNDADKKKKKYIINQNGWFCQFFQLFLQN